MVEAAAGPCLSVWSKLRRGRFDFLVKAAIKAVAGPRLNFRSAVKASAGPCLTFCSNSARVVRLTLVKLWLSRAQDLLYFFVKIGYTIQIIFRVKNVLNSCKFGAHESTIGACRLLSTRNRNKHSADVTKLNLFEK